MYTVTCPVILLLLIREGKVTHKHPQFALLWLYLPLPPPEGIVKTRDSLFKRLQVELSHKITIRTVQFFFKKRALFSLVCQQMCLPLRPAPLLKWRTHSRRSVKAWGLLPFWVLGIGVQSFSQSFSGWPKAAGRGLAPRCKASLHGECHGRLSSTICQKVKEKVRELKHFALQKLKWSINSIPSPVPPNCTHNPVFWSKLATPPCII